MLDTSVYLKMSLLLLEIFPFDLEDIIKRHKAHFVYLPMGALGAPTELPVSSKSLNCGTQPFSFWPRKHPMLVTTASWIHGLDGAYTISTEQRQDGSLFPFLSNFSDC